ncbi:SH2 domain-containing protein [Trichostrongylus colubriformis]|uniref:SH2 domain-containing protein n=1 Tax=Trichostrongylus colubriformis TaxID=6319 RepID=A0AAN8IHX2_TRICO
MASRSKNVKGDNTNEGNSQAGDDAVSITDDVRGAEYYHGLIPRMDAEPLLKKEGDFLLRKTEHSPGTNFRIRTF